MNITAKLQLADGSFSINENDLVAGFVGDECRGVISPIADFDGLLFLTIGSNQLQGETITFIAYIANENIIVELEQTMMFVNQSMVGTPGDPFIFSHSGIAKHLDLQNINITAGQTHCFSALDTISVAGEGTDFVVHENGSATLIAGEFITLLPGTQINSGGYFHAHITDDNQFCPDNDLIYEFYTNKETYYEDETIYLTLAITNNTSFDIINEFGYVGCEFTYSISGHSFPDYACLPVMNYLTFPAHQTTSMYNVHKSSDLFLTAGNYIIEGYFGWHFSDQVEITVVPAPKADTENYKKNDKLNNYLHKPYFIIYPNPSDGLFSVNLFQYDNDAPLTIETYNIQGNLVIREKLLPNQINSIDLQGYPNGVYLLRVMQGEFTDTKRIIKW